VKIFYSESKQFLKCVKDIWDNILIYISTNPFICKTNENAFGKANLCMGENPSYKK